MSATSSADFVGPMTTGRLPSPDETWEASAHILSESFPENHPRESRLLSAMLELNSNKTWSVPMIRSIDSYVTSTASLQGQIARFLRSFEHGLAGYALVQVEKDSIDYLYEDALPETIPNEWFLELEQSRAIEDPSFALPWDEDDSSEEDVRG